MRVLKLKTSPSTEELVGILKREFSNLYSYNLFGLDCERSIMVEKSTFIGAQVYIKGNEITIHGISPTATTTFLSALDFLVTGGFILGLPFQSKREKFEKEIGSFLQQKFN